MNSCFPTTHFKRALKLAYLRKLLHREYVGVIRDCVNAGMKPVLLSVNLMDRPETA